MFWYISKTKIDTLSEMLSSGGILPKALTLRLKVPYVEAEGKWEAKEGSTIKTVRALTAQANQHYSIKSFDLVRDGESPLLVLFKGPAARIVEDKAIWVATNNEFTKKEQEPITQALLLAGSSSNVVGAQEGTGIVSPSADPIGAVKQAFSDPEGDITVSDRLSYAWSAVWQSVGEALNVPCVWGLAVFAARYKVLTSWDLRQLGFPAITRLTIASPLFVQQIERHESLPV
jgi:hypothetical protein